MTFVHSLSASPSHLAPARGPVLPVCAPPSFDTLLVCNWHREHLPDPLRPLPAHAKAACYPGHVGHP
jgi:hypothetical protein